MSHGDPSTGAGGYDLEGNALAYTYSAPSGQTTSYQVSYLKKDGYLEKATIGSGTGQVTTTNTSLYDAFGRRIAIDTNSAGQTTDQVRAFAYNAEGEILQRRDGGATGSTFTVTANGGYATEHYAYVQGQEIGSVDEYGTIDVLSGVTGFSNSDAGTSTYVAQDGDTMESIARQVYGDASLWYVVADANGFEAATDAPAAGQTLKLPEVTTNSNTAETFKPYNPREISGSTTPSLPQAPMPAPSAQHCNGLAVVIVAVVAAFVAPEIEPYLAAAWGGGTVATGAAWFVSGVAANTAGQLASDAVGASNGYSFKEALVAGAEIAVTAGATAGLKETGGVFVSGNGLSPAGAAVVGAADYVTAAAADKLVGLPSQFSWAGLVAAGMSAGITNAAGLSTTQSSTLGTGGTFGQSLAGGLMQGTLNREISKSLGDNRVESWGQIAEDAFGNALGNAAVGAINEAEWKPAQPSINKQAGAIVDSIIGDGASSAGANELPPGYGEAWENGSLYGASGGFTPGSTNASGRGDYSMIVTGDPSKGYPVPVELHQRSRRDQGVVREYGGIRQLREPAATHLSAASSGRCERLG